MTKGFDRKLKKLFKQLAPERIIVFRALWDKRKEEIKQERKKKKRLRHDLPHRVAWLVLAGALANQVYHWDLVDGEWVIRHHSQTYYVGRHIPHRVHKN